MIEDITRSADIVGPDTLVTEALKIVVEHGVPGVAVVDEEVTPRGRDGGALARPAPRRPGTVWRTGLALGAFVKPHVRDGLPGVGLEAL